MSIWFNLFLTGIPDSWAYRWSLVCMANGGMTALPNKNLVTNIGFGEQATHTFGKPLCAYSSSLGVLQHPGLVCRDSEAHYRSITILWLKIERMRRSYCASKKYSNYFAIDNSNVLIKTLDRYRLSEFERAEILRLLENTGDDLTVESLWGIIDQVWLDTGCG